MTTRNHLAFPNGKTSPHARGSLNVSIARHQDCGRVQAALALFKSVREQVTSTSVDLPLNADALDPRTLGEELAHVLRDSEEFTSLGGSRPDQAARFTLLRTLRSKTSGGLLHRIQAAANEIFEKAAHPMRERLRRSLDKAFSDIPRHVDGLRSILQGLDPPPVDFGCFQKATAAFQASEALERDSQLPLQKRNHFCEQLLRHITRLIENQINAVAQQAANDALRNGISKFDPFLDELVRSANRARSCLDQVESILRLRADEQVFFPPASIFVALPTLAIEDHLAAVKHHLRARDQAELPAHLSDRWIEELSRVAHRRCPELPENLGLGALLNEVDAAEATAAFERIIDSLTEGKDSLYAAVARRGTESLAEEMFHRAEEPVDLGGRECPQLYVEPQSLLLARVPEPGNAVEAETLSRLVEKWRKLGSSRFSTRLIPAPANETQITLCRLKVGFPAAVMADCGLLLDWYARAREIKHPPHLPGLVSPDGWPRPSLERFIAATRNGHPSH